jgi:hypothetical protein
MARFSQKLFDTICERIAQGQSLREISKDPDMPSQVSFFKWVGNDEKLAKQYARAREAQADLIFDEILEIADDARNDYMARTEDGEDFQTLNHEHVQRSRLRIDARKWMAGKLAPKKYGDKLEANLNHSGGVRLTVSTGVPDDE